MQFKKLSMLLGHRPHLESTVVLQVVHAGSFNLMLPVTTTLIQLNVARQITAMLFRRLLTQPLVTQPLVKQRQVRFQF